MDFNQLYEGYPCTTHDKPKVLMGYKESIKMYKFIYKEYIFYFDYDITCTIKLWNENKLK